MSDLVIVGRSSSHFSRVVRMVALELDVAHVFRPVFDIASTESANYADNPALKVPILIDEQGPLFGSENICRELKRRASRASSSRAILRGDVRERLVENAEEMTLHVMTSEVHLIMAKMMGIGLPPKVLQSVENSLGWLDENLDAVLSKLPSERAFSFVEVGLFCVVTHLPFREVLDVAPWARLSAFAKAFAERQSARNTEYRFDAP